MKGLLFKGVDAFIYSTCIIFGEGKVLSYIISFYKTKEIVHSTKEPLEFIISS